MYDPCDLPGSVQLNTLEGSSGGDGGRPGPVQHEGDLAKVVAGAQRAHLQDPRLYSHGRRAINVCTVLES